MELSPAALFNASIPITATTTLKSESLLFKGYLHYHAIKASIDPASEILGYVHGPGHHVASVATLLFDENSRPFPVLKAGDARLSRYERGEAYILASPVAGRLDKEGHNPKEIASCEIHEELGAKIVEDTFFHLGEEATPTTPFESTECEYHYLAAITLDDLPLGDGTGMETTELLGPLVASSSQALELFSTGDVAEGGRAQALFERAFHKIGWIPTLACYAQDYPQLQARYQTLGLGPLIDLRPKVKSVALHDPLACSRPPLSPYGVICNDRHTYPLDAEHFMVKAQTQHSVKSGKGFEPHGPSFNNEYLACTYDRAKVAIYLLDPELGPLVRMTAQCRPCLAFAPHPTLTVRLDLEDIKIARDSSPFAQIDEALPGEVMLLGQKTPASSGQCDLYYHFAACWRVSKEPGFLPLADALALCRQGHGDVHTEATLMRLADRLKWIPQLGLSYTQAHELIKGPKV